MRKNTSVYRDDCMFRVPFKFHLKTKIVAANFSNEYDFDEKLLVFILNDHSFAIYEPETK